MQNYATTVSRVEICHELGADDFVLTEYEKFLELPEINNSVFDVNIAKLIARLHGLVKSGLSLNDIKQLSLAAEQFSDYVPGLKSFRDFSPQHHLKELISYYNQMLQELSYREEQYQAKISELENILQSMQNELEKNGIALDQVEVYQAEKEHFKLVLEDKEKVLEDMQVKISELEVTMHQLKHENDLKNDELEKLSAELDFYMSQDPTQTKKSAIDIQALLKKKEKEVSLKFQREIFDLKKQVDLMMEQKEEEWFQKRNKRVNTSSV